MICAACCHMALLRRKRIMLITIFFFLFFLNGVRYLLCMSDTSFEARFVGHIQHYVKWLRFVLHFKANCIVNMLYLYIMFTIQYIYCYIDSYISPHWQRDSWCQPTTSKCPVSTFDNSKVLSVNHSHVFWCQTIDSNKVIVVTYWLQQNVGVSR